jgi:hypothetical protein
MRAIEVVNLAVRAEESGIARLEMFLERSPMRSSVIEEFPQFPVAREYAELQAEFAKASERDV